MTGDIQGAAVFFFFITLTTPSTAPDVFISKHNSLGQIQWAIKYGDTDNEKGTGITTDKKQGRKGRFMDLNDLTIKYYFHPQMKGKTSIKKVLPAIWNNNTYLHAIPWFKRYSGKNGQIDHPIAN